ncbi:28S ribosomal protein S14, mitochondrial-like [Homarus americanus]|uniref:28S ribosomal protein S14, mitochondrial n=1 Tax=Homarus americanus TaxID=6706 RepID=A0A8J5JNF7_HOMAM|nr:28S ribosomal protein S14, mitochondrial-like [Homarus americanus]KAG7161582.1 28S ribosomal protein S14-like [Homarus americanus]
MAASLSSLFTIKLINKIPHTSGCLLQLPTCSLHTTSVACKYPNWKMIKEVKNRKAVKDFAFERINVNALRKNKIIPPAIKEIADKEIAALPRNSSISQLHKRCMLTSRPRGLVTRWRLSRIVWRHEADYNKLSGVQRAMW